MEQAKVVSIDKWSLYKGTLVSLRWPMEQATVVSIDRRSLRQVSLYYKTGQTYCSIVYFLMFWEPAVSFLLL